MRIGLQAYGTAGDIRPMIALAAGLRAAGHVVRLAISSADGADYAGLCARLDIAHIAVGDMSTTRRFDSGRIGMGATRNPFRRIRHLLDATFFPDLDAIYAASRRLCAESDLVIAHFLVYPLQIAAKRAGVPYTAVVLTPGMLPTRHWPPPGRISLPNLGSLANRLIWWAVERVIDREVMGRVAPLWLREGFARPVSVLGNCWQADTLNLIAVSPLLAALAPDWHDRFRLCGFLPIPAEAERWEIPSALRQFFDGGEAPVFMTAGSVQLRSPEDQTGLLIEAAHLAGCRAVIETRSRQMPLGALGDRIFLIGPAAHPLIYPHCSAVLHHAGAQTAMGVTFAGRPSIAMPQIEEQAVWAKALHRLGVAPPPVFGTGPEMLARAIRQVLDSPVLRQRAEWAGQQMHGEDGVAGAVRLIERWAAGALAERPKVAPDP
jgi:sterol 3beta-glucosyltransferase